MTTAPNRIALTRNISFWILLVVSVALAVAGAVLVAQHLGSMTKTLTDGSATGLDVYAGQSWVLIGATLLGAGVLGLLLTLSLTAAATLVAHTAPAASVAPASYHAPSDDDPSDPEGALDAPASAHEILPATTEPTQNTETENAETEYAETENEPEGAASEERAGAEDARDDAQNGSSGSTATATKTSVK